MAAETEDSSTTKTKTKTKKKKKQASYPHEFRPLAFEKKSSQDCDKIICFLLGFTLQRRHLPL